MGRDCHTASGLPRVHSERPLGSITTTRFFDLPIQSARTIASNLTNPHPPHYIMIKNYNTAAHRPQREELVIHLVSCPRNNMTFVAIKMGRRQGGPSRTGTKRARILMRYVTDEQRSRRPIFIATLRAAASWLFFRVARSLRIKSRYARRYRQSGSDRLEKQPTDLRRNMHVFRGQDISR